MSVGEVYQKLIKQRLFRQGFELRMVEVLGQRVHSLDGRFESGEGTLVLVHGLGSSALSLSPLLKRLAPQFERVVAVDLLGHGENKVLTGAFSVELLFQTLSSQLLQISSEPFALYGSSLGGGLCLRFAIEHPEMVSRIALTSPAGAPLAGSDIKRLRRLFSVDTKKGMKALVRTLFHRPPWYGSLLARELRHAMTRPVVRQILDQLEDIPTLNNLEVNRLEMPILLIWGQSETLLPRHCLEWFCQHLPKHAYIEQPFGYGHSPHLEAPEDLCTRLLHFLRRSESSSPPTCDA
ncbi:MAG: alpha/beta fold hydrolase [Bradymonadia bacterium]